jgi:taurine dioxygenase
MKIIPISGALGAEVSGLDLSVKLSNSHISRLYEAFLKHRVLFFREQNLTATDLLKFSKIFGSPPFILLSRGYQTCQRS